MNREKAIKGLIGLAELFDKELSQAVIGFYLEALSRFSDEEISMALNTAMMTCKFFPKPAELVELINGPAGDQAITAWEQLTEAVQRHGAYDSVMFSDTRITRAVEAMGGWIAVCNWPVAELHYRRAEFVKTFMAVKPLKEQKVLAGLVELDNRSRGYFDKLPEPARIGDFRTLKLVEKPKDDEDAE